VTNFQDSFAIEALLTTPVLHKLKPPNFSDGIF